MFGPEWDQVHWADDRFTALSPKSADQGKATRVVPIFLEQLEGPIGAWVFHLIVVPAGFGIGFGVVVLLSAGSSTRSFAIGHSLTLPTFTSQAKARVKSPPLKDSS